MIAVEATFTGSLVVLTIEDADGRSWTCAGVLGPVTSLGQQLEVAELEERAPKVTGIKVLKA